MNTDTITTPKLSCGCQPGYSMCPTAEHLWKTVGDQYWRARNGMIAWRTYHQALQDYQNHYSALDNLVEGK